MSLVRGYFFLVCALGLAAVPMFANRAPGAQRDPISSNSSNVTAQDQTDAQAPVAVPATPPPEKGAHMDHKSKHGGTFFMALDNKHHLEGVLLTPGIFRVYLYDDHTKPLKAEETRQASGTVQVGESDDAPKIDLASGKKKETLEANLGSGVKFPVTLTLLLHLPGMDPEAKPELFDFKFAQFTDEHGPGSCRPMPSMPNMRC